MFTVLDPANWNWIKGIDLAKLIISHTVSCSSIKSEPQHLTPHSHNSIYSTRWRQSSINETITFTDCLMKILLLSYDVQWHKQLQTPPLRLSVTSDLLSSTADELTIRKRTVSLNCLTWLLWSLYFVFFTCQKWQVGKTTTLMIKHIMYC